MIFLKCPVCEGMIPIPLEDAGETVVLVNDAEVEAFVHEHLRHLGEEYLRVIESAGDC